MLKNIDNLADYSNKNSLANKFRNKRFHFFEERMKKLNLKSIKILDVGGTQSFWMNRGYHTNPNIEITLLNLYKEKTDYSNFKGIIGNACDLSEFKNQEFDIAFSNSVIEHLSNFDNQTKMANEVQRVSKFHFVQTPNKYFFLEPHYLLPYFQFFPDDVKLFILSKTKLSRGTKMSLESAKKEVAEVKLLSTNQMKNLFPKSKMYNESFLMMTKSITAYNF